MIFTEQCRKCAGMTNIVRAAQERSFGRFGAALVVGTRIASVFGTGIIFHPRVCSFTFEQYVNNILSLFFAYVCYVSLP